MEKAVLPIFLFAAFATLFSVLFVVIGRFFGPRRTSSTKEMPYESGMDPVHDARRRFNVRFCLVAITFLIFDVEVLFLYPWAVASRAASGIDAGVTEHLVSDRLLVFWGAMAFIMVLVLGFVYDWRKGVFRWR